MAERGSVANPVKRMRGWIGQGRLRAHTSVRREIGRLHLIARAIAPHLPPSVLARVQRSRQHLRRNRTWQWLKAGGGGPRRESAMVAQVFEPEFYRTTYRDLVGHADPLHHYLSSGWQRGLDPSPLFSNEWYVAHLVAEGHARVEPVAHYLTVGWREGRDPAPWFSTRWYSVANPGTDPDRNPLVQYQERGFREGHTVSDEHRRRLLAVDRDDRAPTSPLERWAHVSTPGGDPVDVPLPAIGHGEHDLVSFDLWDTLVSRDRPADAGKVATARRMAIACGSPGRTWELYERRVAVEAAMASESAHQEYELTAVLRRTIDEAHLALDDVPACAAALAEAELIDEIEGTVAIPETMALLHRFVRADRAPRVIILSDFYIGSAGLSRVLRHHGVGEEVTVVASVDEGASKRLGTVFPVLHERFGVAPERHLHIGDNRYADGEMAVAAGVQAAVVRVDRGSYPAAGELTRRWYQEAVAELEVELDAVAAGLIGTSGWTLAQQGALAAGVRTAALTVAHVAGAIERAVEVGAGAVHYLSREGAFLARLHGEVAPTLFGRAAPRAVHLAVSRRSTFGPSLGDTDAKSLRRMWRQYQSQSPAALLASLGLDVKDFAADLRKHGLRVQEVVPQISEDLRVRSFLESPDVARRVADSLGGQRQLLLEYLGDRGLHASAEHVVVDVGWRGTIQDNLCYVLPEAQLHGVYLGLFPYLNPQPVNATKRAVVFDGNFGDEYAFVDPPAAIEAPLTPAIPSVAGYREIDGVVTPVEQPETGRAEHLIAAFEQGMLLGADTVARRYASWGATGDLLKPGLQDALRRYYAQPLPGVADIWFFSAHDDTFGALNVTPYGKQVPDLSLTYGDVSPSDRPAARASQWAEGWAAWLPVRAMEAVRVLREEAQRAT